MKQQKKDGYTKIPNKVFDYILTADLKPLELKLLLYIIRKTLGYNREVFRGGYGKISKATGYSRHKTLKAVDTLVKRNILHVKIAGTKNHTPNIFQISTSIDDWVHQLYPSTSNLRDTSNLQDTTSSNLQDTSTSNLQDTSYPLNPKLYKQSQDPTLQYIHNNNITTVNTPPNNKFFSAEPQPQKLKQLPQDLQNLLNSKSKQKFNLPPDKPNVVIPDFTF